ncbi:hypothetical protein IAH97_01555 [Neoehrlichia mikurensis]|uniref:Uncharacterized protein n=2 Tax=Neoehrlichia mikurensis TaxID=89586 RepID=A0ABY5EXZ5_9RICK|nr:hypothetical protein [Neoehrlichia mikurensis]QXK92230.1 hypothetical protein IAH97_01555 [Neoehrlichia mikurensis]QXK92685.1 hypothetical protein HUN61_01550 [Neoehrlichia mikurensis]UTO55993.1 hypothetical protein LUA81_02535 [Neoehrlichia mikurensis]
MNRGKLFDFMKAFISPLFRDETLEWMLRTDTKNDTNETSLNENTQSTTLNDIKNNSEEILNADEAILPTLNDSKNNTEYTIESIELSETEEENISHDSTGSSTLGQGSQSVAITIQPKEPQTESSTETIQTSDITPEKEEVVESVTLDNTQVSDIQQPQQDDTLSSTKNTDDVDHFILVNDISSSTKSSKGATESQTITDTVSDLPPELLLNVDDGNDHFFLL